MKMLFVGDVMLGRLVNQALKNLPPEYPFGDTLPLFKNADLRICNLECVLSNVGEPWSITPKVFHFRTDEKNLKTLEAANIDLISIANNHVLDYSYEGLTRMLKVFKQHKVNFSGSGNNFKKASSATVIERDSRKIAFIAFTDNEPAWEATEERAGLFYCPINVADSRAKYLFEQCANIKKKADILIVSAHWGPNWGYFPPPEHIPFAHRLIDAGVDVVFGHSGHITRGIEFYKGKVILYCTGDFIDDYAVDEIERNDESFIFIVELTNDKIARVLLYPTIIKDFQAHMAVGDAKTLSVLKMQALCDKLGSVSQWNSMRGCLEVWK